MQIAMANKAVSESEYRLLIALMGLSSFDVLFLDRSKAPDLSQRGRGGNDTTLHSFGGRFTLSREGQLCRRVRSLRVSNFQVFI
jgi:hypothetical protein